ncbi:MAG: hypothetical protein ABIX01_21675 [Chitinophagaceae bacterium]
MKRLAAILLSAILLFDWYGYQPLMNWLDTRADLQMARQLDAQQYDESSLIEITVPTNLPYTNNWTTFERVDGSIEFNGQHYNYVMQKMVDGKMIYKCIPNQDKNKVSNARNEFYKLAFDSNKIDPSKKQDTGKSLSFKKAMDDFTNTQFRIRIAPISNDDPAYLSANVRLANGFDVLPYQPPQA